MALLPPLHSTHPTPLVEASPPSPTPSPPTHRCWTFINVAVKVLDNLLREDFGFKHLLFVFSGRRGMHVWVSDEAARSLTDEQRNAVLGYVNVFSTDSTASAGYGGGGGGEGSGSSGSGSGSSGSGSGSGGGHKDAKHLVGFFRVLNGLSTPLHPSLQRAFSQLEAIFVRDVITEEGQKLLCDPEKWDKVLDMIPTLPEDALPENTTLRGLIAKAWLSASNPVQRWRQLKNTLEGVLKRCAQGEIRLRPDMRRTIEKVAVGIVFTFTYPRLDVEVSKHRNHLLKAPFCIHPKTGKICVPIQVKSVEEFDPNAVPTCSKLMDEGNARMLAVRNGKGGGAGDSSEDLWAHTSLKPYIGEFEEFLKEVQVSTNRARRLASEKSAIMGEW